MKIAYSKQTRFSAQSREWIGIANGIIQEYQAEGLTLTLRQLYYQFVARNHCANNERNYQNMSKCFSSARLAGLMDWEALEDRTRFVRRNSHWETPQEILTSVANQFAVDKWADQQYRVEVWIEKDALIGVIADLCETLDVPYFSCRGYTSQSEQWRAGLRMAKAVRDGQQPVVFHLGDHDPSGIDMTRDNQDRLNMFCGAGVIVERLALNMKQVEQYDPPPNPTKLTDSRTQGYQETFETDECWELDALDPKVLTTLVRKNVARYRDEGLWAKAVKREVATRAELALLPKHYAQVVKYAKGLTK